MRKLTPGQRLQLEMDLNAYVKKAKKLQRMAERAEQLGYQIRTSKANREE